jgi:hypothetical protein
MAAVSQYSSLIQSAAAQYGLSPSLLAAVMQAESSGNATAVSPAGAMGLMQLMPQTAAQYGVTSATIFDPATNIDAGAHYLSDLVNQFGNVNTALAAYNWGPGNVSSGQAIPASVQAYVANVMAQAGSTAQWAGDGTGPVVDLSGAAATQPTPDILSQLANQLALPDLSSAGVSPGAELALLGLGAAALLWVVGQ